MKADLQARLGSSLQQVSGLRERSLIWDLTPAAAQPANDEPEARHRFLHFSHFAKFNKDEI